MHSGFNPKARWDKFNPETSTQENSQPNKLDEKIETLARFNGGKILPEEFIWNNKTYLIKKINYSWQEHRGKEIVNFFSVDTGGDIYQISFNNTTYGWRMDKIIS